MKTFLRRGLWAMVLLNTIFCSPVIAETSGNTPDWVLSNTESDNDAYKVSGETGDMGRQHNNGKTDTNAEYETQHPWLPTPTYRFTGDAPQRKTNTTQTKELRQMVFGNLNTETGLLSPDSGKSFAGASDFGFTGDSGAIYHSLYNKGAVGGVLPGVGTGEVSLSVLDSGEYDNGGKFLVAPSIGRIALLKEYIAAGGKISRGSVSQSEMDQLGLTDKDLFDDPSY
jgi:hypothetical protein